MKNKQKKIRNVKITVHNQRLLRNKETSNQVKRRSKAVETKLVKIECA